MNSFQRHLSTTNHLDRFPKIDVSNLDVVEVNKRAAHAIARDAAHDQYVFEKLDRIELRRNGPTDLTTDFRKLDAAQFIRRQLATRAHLEEHEFRVAQALDRDDDEDAAA